MPDTVQVQGVEQDIVTNLIAEGRPCGGEEQICAGGLVCLPASEGSELRVCKTAVVDTEKECNPYNVKEVCGERDGETTTYLNECFAAKNGATVVGDGYCE